MITLAGIMFGICIVLVISLAFAMLKIGDLKWERDNAEKNEQFYRHEWFRLCNQMLDGHSSNEINPAEVKKQDEQNEVYRGYSNVEHGEGALIAKKELVGPSEAQEMTLEDRINNVIHTQSFEKTLNNMGYCIADFQLTWHTFKTFDELPTSFKEAILAGEKELSSPKLVDIQPIIHSCSSIFNDPKMSIHARSDWTNTQKLALV